MRGSSLALKIGFAVALPLILLALALDAHMLPALSLSLVAGALAGWWGRIHVGRTVDEASSAIEALARGDDVARLPVEGRDEVARLATTVNEMASELRREHDERAAILSGMEEGVVALDRNARVVLVNDAARELLGAQVDDLSRVPEVDEAVRRCLREDERVTGEAAHEGRVLQLTAAPGPSGCVLVLRDITDVRHLERVRRDFVSNVSHELKTPLTAMKGYLEAVVDDPDMDAQTARSFLEKAHKNTNRLVAIVSDLLSLARLESGSEAVELQTLDLAVVANDCLRDAAAIAEPRGVALQVDIESAPLLVDGDRKALIVAVMNLLDNAIKYSPRGDSVLLKAWSEGDDAWIEVRDHGPGIPAHEHERIFERFYRLDKVRSRELGGTGLGLSIVKNTALAHGGEVSVESGVGRGSAFRLRLPRSRHEAGVTA